jgi:hypothetical protein
VPEGSRGTAKQAWRHRLLDLALRRSVLFPVGAGLAVAGATYIGMQSIDLTPRGTPAVSDAAFDEKYCARAAAPVPGLIVAQPNPQRVDVDATVWSMLPVDRRRAFVVGIGCVSYGHPMTAGEHFMVLGIPSHAVLADADGATIRILE